TRVGELNLEALKLNCQNRCPPDDRALGSTGVVDTTKIGQMRSDDVLAPAHPRRAPSTLCKNRVPLVMRLRPCFGPAIGGLAFDDPSSSSMPGQSASDFVAATREKHRGNCGGWRKRGLSH